MAVGRMGRVLWTLSYFFGRMLLRERATWLLGGLGALAVLTALVLAPVNIAVKYRFFENFLLVSQGVLLHMGALLYGFELLRREKLGGLYLLPLSAGTPRCLYLLSHTGGIKIAIGASLGLLLLTDAVLLWGIEGELSTAVLLQVGLFGLSAMLLGVLIVALGVYVSPINAVVYALIIYLIGQSTDDALLFAVGGRWELPAEVLYRIWPPFGAFDLVSPVVNRLPLEWVDLLFPLAAYIIWLGVMMAAAGVHYERKALVVGR